METLIGGSVSKLKQLLADKAVSSNELTLSYYKHIEKHDANINAFLCLTKELSLKQADNIDHLIKSKAELPILAGIPTATTTRGNDIVGVGGHSVAYYFSVNGCFTFQSMV